MPRRSKTLAARFGKRVAQRRKELGWSQDQLAARAGATGPGVSHAETGKHVPRLDVASQYARALGMSLDDLVAVRATRGGARPAYGHRRPADGLPPPPSRPGPRSPRSSPPCRRTHPRRSWSVAFRKPCNGQSSAYSAMTSGRSMTARSRTQPLWRSVSNRRTVSASAGFSMSSQPPSGRGRAGLPNAARCGHGPARATRSKAATRWYRAHRLRPVAHL